jgi:hypothetical protein
MRWGLAVFALFAAAPAIFVCCKDREVAQPAPPPTPSVSAAAAATASTSVTASASSAATAAAPTDCGASLAAAGAGVAAVLKKYSACKVDDDCTTVRGGPCIAACDRGIAKAGVSEHEAATKRAQPACNAWFASDCVNRYPVPVPSCPMLYGRCKNGVCAAELK